MLTLCLCLASLPVLATLWLVFVVPYCRFQWGQGREAVSPVYVEPTWESR